MPRPRARTALLVTAVLLTGLSGCGGDDPDTDPAPTTTATPLTSASAGALSSASSTATTRPSAGPTAPRPSTPVASAAPLPGKQAGARLSGDGIDASRGLVEFGTAFDQAAAALKASLGAPSADSGEIRNTGQYGACDAVRLRGLEYGGGALRILFGADAKGPLKMFTWQLSPDGTPRSVPRASALVGDVTTYEFGIGTTVAQLRKGAGQYADIREGDEMLDPNFRVDDQSSGFYGHLTGTKPGDTVTYVEAGKSCGE